MKEVRRVGQSREGVRRNGNEREGRKDRSKFRKRNYSVQTASREAGNGSKFGFGSNIIMVTIVKSL